MAVYDYVLRINETHRGFVNKTPPHGRTALTSSVLIQSGRVQQGRAQLSLLAVIYHTNEFRDLLTLYTDGLGLILVGDSADEPVCFRLCFKVVAAFRLFFLSRVLLRSELDIPLRPRFRLAGPRSKVNSLQQLSLKMTFSFSCTYSGLAE